MAYDRKLDRWREVGLNSVRAKKACMSELSASVGLAGVNRHLDVATVQRLLVGQHVPTGPVDGRCGRLTIGAIVNYQRRFMHEPDGRVDVRGPTWRRLNHDAVAGAPSSNTHAAGPAPAS